MADPYYVKFETPEDLVNPIYEAVRVSAENGKVKRGTNETTKAVERGTSKLVVIAKDVDPPELVAHLPILCEEQNSAYVFVPNKQLMGFDQHMNLILDSSEEFGEESNTKTLGTIVVRGDNVIMISPPPGE